MGGVLGDVFLSNLSSYRDIIENANKLIDNYLNI